MIIYGGYFDTDNKLKRISELEKELEDPSIWNDQERAKKVIDENKALKEVTSAIINIKNKITDNLDTIELLSMDMDEELVKLIEEDMPNINKDVEKLELEILLSDE